MSTYVNYTYSWFEMPKAGSQLLPNHRTCRTSFVPNVQRLCRCFGKPWKFAGPPVSVLGKEIPGLCCSQHTVAHTSTIQALKSWKRYKRWLSVWPFSPFLLALWKHQKTACQMFMTIGTTGHMNMMYHIWTMTDRKLCGGLANAVVICHCLDHCHAVATAP